MNRIVPTLNTAEENPPVAYRLSPVVWEYRGFKIHTKKVPLQPRYYAWIYEVAGTRPGYRIGWEQGDAIDSRAKVVEMAKAFIDGMIDAEFA